MHEIPKPSDPSTPIEEPRQMPEHVPELPPLHDPDPQQETDLSRGTCLAVFYRGVKAVITKRSS